MVSSSNGRLLPAAALTTVWTPPCGLDRWFTEPNKDKILVPQSCRPPNWGAYFTNVDGRGAGGYYSPAICPSGFTLGCSRFSSDQGPEPLPGETAYNCVQR